MPELVALVLAFCLQSPQIPSELAIAALGAIKPSSERALLFLPSAVADSASLYRRLIEISTETRAQRAGLHECCFIRSQKQISIKP